MQKKWIMNEKGITPLLVLGAVMVLFVTITLIKVSTLERFDPDLSRIGINLSPSATPSNVAQDDTTTNSNQVVENPEPVEEESFTASSELEVESEPEGDNPAYIE